MKRAGCLLICLLLGSSLFPITSVWKITKNGNTLYLGGTIHLLQKSDFPLPPEFDYAFSKSEIMVFECPFDSKQLTLLVIQKWMLPAKKTLKTELEAETFALLKEKCDELNYPINNLMKFKPIPALITLSGYEYQRLKYSTGVDPFMYKRAVHAGKQLDYLEAAEFQIEIAADLGAEYGDAYILEFIMSSFNEDREKRTRTMIDNWRRGVEDESSLADMLNEKEKFPSAYEALISGRNANWLPKLEAYLADAPVEFVLVGVSHMYGPDGLLELLKNAGCEVEYLELPPKLLFHTQPP
jgi:uncharacterized protein YbaP (TraB family)